MDDPAAAGPSPVGRGRRAWRQASWRRRLAWAAVPIIVGVVAGYCAIQLAGAALNLETPGGVENPGAVLDQSTSWLPPGERSTVLSNGQEVSVLQPWHDAPLGTVVLGLGTGLVAAGLIALPALMILGSVTRPSHDGTTPVAVS